MKITQHGDAIIVIGATDETKAAIDSALKRTDDLEKKTGSILDKMKAKWFEVAAAVMALHTAFRMIEHAAAFQDQMTRMESFAKAHHTSAQAIIDDLTAITQGMMSQADTVAVATEAMMKGLSPEQIKDFAQYADALGDTLGIKVPDAMRAMIDASISGRGAWKLGAVEAKDLDAVLGKQVSTMNEHQKIQARVNIMLDTMKRNFQGVSKEALTVSDRIDQFKATLQNWYHVAGVLLIKAVAGIGWVFAKVGETILTEVSKWILGIAEFSRWVGKATGAKWIQDFAAGTQDVALGLMDGAGEARKFADQAAFMAVNFGKLDNVQKAVLPDMTKNLAAADKAADEAGKRVMKWYEGMLKEAAEAQKVIEQKKKLVSEYNEFKIKLDDEFLEIAEKHMQEAARKEEELWRTQARLYIEIKKQQYEQSFQAYFDLANSLGGEMGKGAGMVGAGLKGMSDISSGKDPYSDQMNQLAMYWDARLEYMRTVGASEAEIDAEYKNIMLTQEQLYQQQRLQLASNTMGMMAGMMYSLSQAQGKHNQTAFTAYKAFAIAQTVIDTYKAAMGAFASLSSIPYVGYALGLAAAAATIAFGMAKVAAIKSMQPGGSASASAGGGTIPSGGGGYSYNNPQQGSWQKSEPPQASKSITVVVNGNIVDHSKFVRELAPYINEAKGDNLDFGN